MNMPKASEERPWEWGLMGNKEYGEVEIASLCRAYSFPSTEGFPIDNPMVLTPEDVAAVIAQIDSIKRVPCRLQSDVITNLIKVDDL